MGNLTANWRTYTSEYYLDEAQQCIPNKISDSDTATVSTRKNHMKSDTFFLGRKHNYPAFWQGKALKTLFQIIDKRILFWNRIQLAWQIFLILFKFSHKTPEI